jgi:hypothetical protein
MKRITCVLAILAAASTAAMAGDLKQDKKDTTPPTVSATQMSDSEMDKVTAGAGGAVVSGQGPDVTVTLPFQGSAALGASSTGNLHAGQAANLGGTCFGQC